MRGKEENIPSAKRKSVPFARRILRPLVSFAIADALIMILALSALGVLSTLNRQSYDVLDKKVENRQSYLQTQMTHNWMALDDLASFINSRTDMMRRAKKLNMATLDSSSNEVSSLLLQIQEKMIAKLYSCQASGIFVIFNSGDLDAEISSGAYVHKNGMYIRDNDPLSASSVKYADLLLECAPISVTLASKLSTDIEWEHRYRYGDDRPYENWFTQPYLTALHAEGQLTPAECGLWTTKTDASGTTSIVYSIPLILDNGTVYGVLGIELLPRYLTALLPNTELGASGFYAIVMSEGDEEAPLTSVQVCAVSGKNDVITVGDTPELMQLQDGKLRLQQNGRDYEIAAERLNIYSRNAPFDYQRWYVIGAVPTDSLYSFSTRVTITMIASALFTLSVGLAAAYVIARRIAQPVVTLEKQLSESGKSTPPGFAPTGISEIDSFARTITDLSIRMVSSSRRFLSIMEMSSIDIGGYELDNHSRTAFVTDSFFPLLGRPDVDTKGMIPESFRKIMREIYQNTETEIEENGILYCVPREDGTVRYIHVEETRKDYGVIGVAEDVTTVTLERKRIEHERDYDLLTGILNRRAFYHESEPILADTANLGIAALFMVDLDNLKTVNDTYGHEWGDRYLITAANCLLEHSSGKALVSRVAGDEFNVLMYGFRAKSEVYAATDKLQQAFKEAILELPNGQTIPVSASGGFVFTTESSDLKLLSRYADFAMYQVKHSWKGNFGEFNRKLFEECEIQQQKQRAFKRVLNEKKIRYVFQPIVNARTGHMYACEALMRVMDQDITDTDEFLRLAKEADALGEIESITWTHALEAFHNLVQSGSVDPKTRIFVNSQVSQILGAAEQQVLIERFGDIRENAVMEVVETDSTLSCVTNLRNNTQDLFALDFALDDYGTGYNSEKNLLELMPRYVKLDMSLVRGIERHKDRQHLIRGFIHFAHDRDMVVLGEGVETRGELQCLLELGVDMLQGFFLARPAEIPPAINPEALEMIRSFAENDSEEIPSPYSV